MDLIDYRNGIYAFDAGYVRPKLAAIHLIVDSGRAAFIDTGHNDSVPHSLAALAALGLAPDAVDYIILTHIHLDHAGGAGAMMRKFPNAKLLVHPRGGRHMVDPGKLWAATEEVYGRDNARALYGEIVPIAAGRVVETTDGQVVSIGGRNLALYDSPGHAKHHIFIHDRTANGIFTGDSFGISYREMDVAGRSFVFPSTTPSQFDPVALRTSVAHMLALNPEAVYLTHFSRIAPPQDLARDMLRRLDELIRIARAAGKRTDPEGAIRADMTGYLLREVRAHGVTLTDDEVVAIWQTDIDLNAQGLAIWNATNPGGSTVAPG